MKLSRKVSNKARALFHKQNGICHYCKVQMTLRRGLPSTVTVDHKLPKSQGGTRHKHNTVGACFSCNNAKGNMPYEDYLRVVAKNGRPDRRPSPEPDFKQERRERSKSIVTGDAAWKKKKLSHRPYLDDIGKHTTLADALVAAGFVKEEEE
jgi:CRISPR/Cas system Type II protein with McrA/HNH and RuvC-like nuclease domain